jgi:predicted membrane protein
MMGIGGQYHSIAHSGMALFDRPIRSLVGGTVIDLASAPLVPGEHRLEIETGLGGVEIYLPRYVRFVVESGDLGGEEVHEGLPLWDRLFRRIKVAPPPGGDRPILIRISIDRVIGGLDIYRV